MKYNQDTQAYEFHSQVEVVRNEVQPKPSTKRKKKLREPQQVRIVF